MSSLTVLDALTPIGTNLTPCNFATHPSTDLAMDADLESDPDTERLVPYEPGYPDGKGPLHEATIRQILTACQEAAIFSSYGH